MATSFKILKAIGQQIKLQRNRRLISEKEIAFRAGIARSTLQLIEKGAPSVRMGSYISVMMELNFERDLIELGADDLAGWRLQESRMRQYQRRKINMQL